MRVLSRMASRPKTLKARERQLAGFCILPIPEQPCYSSSNVKNRCMAVGGGGGL